MNDAFNDNIEDIRRLKNILFDLRLKYDAVKGESLRSDIKSVIRTGDRLYAELVRNNSKTPAAHRFIYSYLPAIGRILDRYNLLVKNNIRSADSLKVRKDIAETMPVIQEALKRYYESMFTAEIADADIEMEALLRRI